MQLKILSLSGNILMLLSNSGRKKELIRCSGQRRNHQEDLFDYFFDQVLTFFHTQFPSHL